LKLLRLGTQILFARFFSVADTHTLPKSARKPVTEI